MQKLDQMLPQQSQLSRDGTNKILPVEKCSKAPPRELVERVERIFEALSIHYGAMRMSTHWQGNDPERVKAYWALRLGETGSDSVAYALKNLPAYPPNIDEFLAIASRRPRYGNLAVLDTPRTPPEIAAKRLTEIKARFPKFRINKSDELDGHEGAV